MVRHTHQEHSIPARKETEIAITTRAGSTFLMLAIMPRRLTPSCLLIACTEEASAAREVDAAGVSCGMGPDRFLLPTPAHLAHGHDARHSLPKFA